MDLIKAVDILSKECKARSIHYAIIGGFAMNALGLVRGTVDIDILVMAQDTPALQNLLASLGYTCAYKSENVSQYTSPSGDLGEIDVLHAFRPSSLKMLARCKIVSLMNAAIELNVLLPEDIVGLKLQALMNDETRKPRELADIHMILDHFKNALDWQIIEDHFNLFDQQALFQQLRRQYG